jgi:hypothetical protein
MAETNNSSNANIGTEPTVLSRMCIALEKPQVNVFLEFTYIHNNIIYLFITILQMELRLGFNIGTIS